MYFSIDSENLKLLLALSEKLGEVNGMHFNRPERMQQKSYTVTAHKACLELIEIKLSKDQVEKLSNRYIIKAPANEVKASKKLLNNFSSLNEKSFTSLRDFNQVNNNLASYSLQNIAPPPLPKGVSDLFNSLKGHYVPTILKATQFHYEMLCLMPKNPAAIELALYWQKLILVNSNEVFRYLDYESNILKEKEKYLRFVRNARPGKKADRFNRFMMGVLTNTVEDYLRKEKQSKATPDRIALFIKNNKDESFSRQDYMRKFKFISAITASRDLRYAVEAGLFTKKGEKRFTRYRLA